MIIRKYIANSVEEAQKAIAEEFGPNATVLTMRYIKQSGWRAWFTADRVEVTASIKQEDLEAYTNKRIGSLQNKEVPKKETQKTETTEKESLKESLFALKASIKKDVDLDLTESELHSEKEVLKAPVYSDPRLRKEVTFKKEVNHERALRKLASLRRELPPKEKEEKIPQQKDFVGLGKGLIQEFSTSEPRRINEKRVDEQEINRLDTLRKVIREELSVVNPMTPQGKDARFLIRKGIDSQIANQLDEEVTRNLKGVSFETEKEERTARLNKMLRAIASRIRTTGPLQVRVDRGPMTVAIVGATGVGKTTTLTKIAGYYTRQGYKVSVISIDTVKVGAREQIRALTHRLGLELSVATDALELRAAVATHRDADLILIDTAGQSQYHTDEVENLAKILKSLRNVQVLLAISATTKDVDSYGSTQQFSCFDIDSLIVTKVDETISEGILVNISQKTELPLRYLTTGQSLREDLEVADAISIARGLLLDHNEKRFDKVRRMVATAG